MDIPINVDVFCGKELCGRSTCLIINPVNEHVTHLVVAEKEFPNIERLVPVTNIGSTTVRSVQLNCSIEEVAKMEPFRETDFIDSGKLETALPYEVPYMIWPYSIHEIIPMPLEYEHLPAGTVAVHRGAPVRATDGRVGKVDEFLVDPNSDAVSHLILREGHLWGEKDVTIPVSKIDKIDEDAVYLKLDKKAVAELPAIPVTRKWK